MQDFVEDFEQHIMKTMLFLFKNHIHDVNDLLIIMSYVLAKLHFYVDCNIYYLLLPGLWPVASLITMITYIITMIL